MKRHHRVMAPAARRRVMEPAARRRVMKPAARRLAVVLTKWGRCVYNSSIQDNSLKTVKEIRCAFRAKRTVGWCKTVTGNVCIAHSGVDRPIM